MNRGEAIARIQQGLGFITHQSTAIAAMLKEAQRDLERGKTLPRFLLQENQPLTLLSGASTVALPTRFIRPGPDGERTEIRYTAVGASKPTFIPWSNDPNLTLGVFSEVTPGAPPVAILRNTVIDFVVTANQNYTLYWSYYKGAAILDTDDTTNEWLNEATGAPEWLIGEAGYRMAKPKRDKDAIADFDGMRTQGRAACFGEILAKEMAQGPLVMGAEN